MYIKKEINDFYELKEECWSGAIDTLNTIEEKGLENELIDLLNEVFDDAVEIVEVNDYLWFEDNSVFESLGLTWIECKGEWYTEDELEELLDELQELYEQEPGDLTDDEIELLEENGRIDED